MSDTNEKAVLQALSDVLNAISNVESGSWLSLIIGAIGDLKDGGAALAALTGIVPEYLSLTEADRADLETFVANNILLPSNVTIQGFLQKVLDLVISASSLLQMIRPVKK